MRRYQLCLWLKNQFNKDRKNMDKVGFIGLGIMGRPMAGHLLKAGFSVTVYNRSKAPVEALTQVGAIPADSPKAVAAQSDVIITMLPTAKEISEVLTGENGVFQGIKPGSVVIDMSTISPVDVREIAEKAEEYGAIMLDAPVSGGDKGAIAGTLSIMVGGDEAAFNRCLPVFQAMGKTVTRVGDSGAGATVKACNQIVVAMHFLALSEALVLGSKAGVEPQKIIEALGGGMANSRVLEMRGESMVKHEFIPGGRVALHHKDLGIATALARAFDVPLPATTLVAQVFTGLTAMGFNEIDHSAVLLYIEHLANHKI
jgi:2-hydroxy-3-oxopropionate reductase